MTDDLPRILSALEKVDGVTVTSAWPREPPAVPVVLVTLAGERAADRRDDRWYLTELEYYVRVFAAKSGELRRVVAAVDGAMRDLGSDLAFRWDEPGEGWRQAAMRPKTRRAARAGADGGTALIERQSPVAALPAPRCVGKAGGYSLGYIMPQGNTRAKYILGYTTLRGKTGAGIYPRI